MRHGDVGRGRDNWVRVDVEEEGDWGDVDSFVTKEEISYPRRNLG